MLRQKSSTSSNQIICDDIVNETKIADSAADSEKMLEESGSRLALPEPEKLLELPAPEERLALSPPEGAGEAAKLNTPAPTQKL